ncbi:MAG: aromatic ring-hydroxylating dioxygenase subunit alpha [Acetobacteraceae bacterium]
MAASNALLREPPEWQVQAAQRPLAEAATLPAACYTSEEWYAREVAQIFHREWICVGRTDQAVEPGDYFTMTLANEPILIVRDRDSGLRAYSNVCRHRGCLIASGSGNAKTLQCPYHRWTYALSGELLATPGRPHPMQELLHFRQEDYGLVPIRLACWGGFVFVNLSDTAPPLHQWLGDLPSWMDAYDFAAMATLRRVSHIVDCNWKVFLENSMEAYHVPFVHQRQVDPARLPVWSVEQPGNGPYGALYSKDSLLVSPVFPTIPALRGKSSEGLFHLWLQPNLQIVATPAYMSFRQYLPRAAGSFELSCGWCFPPATLDAPGFADAAGAMFERSDAVMQEDIEICPQVQAGLGSSLYRPGRYATQEAILHQIGRYVLGKVLGH